jgi:hypothetical protein
VARDLERQVTVGRDEEIESIIWGPELEPPFKLLFPATDQMLMAAHVIGKIYGLDVKEKFEFFSGRSRELSEQDEAREAG